MAFATTLQEKKRLEILLKFKFFQELNAGVQQQLSTIVQNLSAPEGKVLFRQGDPPGNCYVLLEGEVGIFIKSEEELKLPDTRHGTPRGDAPPAFHDDEADLLSDDDAEQPTQPPSRAASRPSFMRSSPTPADDTGTNTRSVSRGSLVSAAPAIRRCASIGDDADSTPRAAGSKKTADASRNDIPEETKIERDQTLEGFSLYHSASILGFQVAALKAGSMFGELALMNEAPRSATIKCNTACEFLVIARADFDTMLKAEMIRQKEEKISFLSAHIPGFKDLPKKTRPGRPHPSYYFHKIYYPKGHIFLKQGQVTPDVVWVVTKGSVEFWHKDPVPKFTADELAVQKGLERIKSGVAFPPSGTVSPGKIRPSSGNRLAGYSSKGRRVGLLLTGGLFGALPTSDPEPFTVEASTSCEVLFLSGSQMARVSKQLITTIQEYIVHSVTWRLTRCIEGRIAIQVQAQAMSQSASRSPSAVDLDIGDSTTRQPSLTRTTQGAVQRASSVGRLTTTQTNSSFGASGTGTLLGSPGLNRYASGTELKRPLSAAGLMKAASGEIKRPLSASGLTKTTSAVELKRPLSAAGSLPRRPGAGGFGLNVSQAQLQKFHKLAHSILPG
jgi:CRP-like cAMP-binding protein